jgi:hypothetical protein
MPNERAYELLAIRRDKMAEEGRPVGRAKKAAAPRKAAAAKKAAPAKKAATKKAVGAKKAAKKSAAD